MAVMVFKTFVDGCRKKTRHVSKGLYSLQGSPSVVHLISHFQIETLRAPRVFFSQQTAQINLNSTGKPE
jgi:hypothetical protein